MPDDLAGTNSTVDVRREAEALNWLLKAVLLPAVSGCLVLCALLCVCLGAFFLMHKVPIAFLLKERFPGMSALVQENSSGLFLNSLSCPAPFPMGESLGFGPLDFELPSLNQGNTGFG